MFKESVKYSTFWTNFANFGVILRTVSKWQTPFEANPPPNYFYAIQFIGVAGHVLAPELKITTISAEDMFLEITNLRLSNRLLTERCNWKTYFHSEDEFLESLLKWKV